MANDELIQTPTGERPLSVRESERLTELEGIIEANFKGFYLVGKALTEIRDSKLYREQYGTFKAYLKKVWEMAERRGYQLIDASEVVDTVKSALVDESNSPQKLNNCTVFETDQNPSLIPINEAQARELAKLPPEGQLQAWKIANNLASQKDGRVTAKLVRRAVSELAGHSIIKAVQRTRNQVPAEDRYSPAFRNAFEAFLKEINAAMLDGFKSTSKAAIIRHIQALEQLTTCQEFRQ